MTQPVPAHERAKKILDEIRGVRSLSGVDERSVSFLQGLVARGVSVASQKQGRWLGDIERKVFPETEDRE